MEVSGVYLSERSAGQNQTPPNVIYLEQHLDPYSIKAQFTSPSKFASVSEARFTCYKAFLQ